MKTCRMLLSAAILTGLAAGAHADIAIVDRLGGPVTMQSQSMRQLFGAASPTFTNSALASVHSSLHADGIVTEGRITALLTRTGDSGLAFMILVDDENEPGDFQNVDSTLGFSSTGPSTATLFVNDEPQDVLFRQDLGNGTILASGLFSWDSQRDGDALAWSELNAGDYLAFSFRDRQAPGLIGGDLFQFVSWNGESWETIATSRFSSNGHFAFTLQVVPGPAAAGLLLVAGAAVRRRRRA